jgi:hypothetical protein
MILFAEICRGCWRYCHRDTGCPDDGQSDDSFAFTKQEQVEQLLFCVYFRSIVDDELPSLESNAAENFWNSRLRLAH